MFPIARFRVSDRSMEPGLSPGDYVLVNRWAYALARPEPGDLVVLRDPIATDRFLVKRVADVTATGVVVVGDNEASSRDSRAFGPVTHEAIVGKVWRAIRR